MEIKTFEANGVLTEKQAAEYLNIAQHTLRTWRRKKLIPFYLTPSGRPRYYLSELEQVIKTGNFRKTGKD